eukprot:m.342988 g.342988  ORF g.342988 m.342988 type:complete len:195 (+) comp19848_c1_seq1:2282-2866(+)
MILIRALHTGTLADSDKQQIITRTRKVDETTMRAILQRVTRASVSVDGEVVSAVGRGLCLLIGIARDDTEEDSDYIARKVLSLRLFDAEDGRMWRQNVGQSGLEILSVSQFTLYAKTAKGNKPDFHLAMGADDSKAFYDQFLEKLRKGLGDGGADKVKDGVFGAMMQVEIINDGPVTIVLDSNAKDPETKPESA